MFLKVGNTLVTGYTVSYPHSSRKLLINPFYLGEVRVIIFIQICYCTVLFLMRVRIYFTPKDLDPDRCVRNLQESMVLKNCVL